MILINTNQVNFCYFTLTEKATLANPYYLFKFESIDTNKVVLFTGTDVSSNTERYNKFMITETSGATNFTAATINLDPGEYAYTVYQMSGQTNLALSGTSGIVETGQVLVSGATQTSYTYTGTDDDESAVYFNN